MKRERRQQTETRKHQLQAQDLAEVRGGKQVANINYNGPDGPDEP